MRNGKDDCKNQNYNERRQKDIGVWNKGNGAVAIGNGFGIGKHGFSDERTDDTRNQNL